MPGATYPPVFLEPIASTAGGGFITNPMPDAPTGTNAASVQGGFPPVTMQEEIAGGEPPLGQDMNGFLYLLSSHTFFAQCGQGYQYSAPLAAEIGGYLAGTILGMADGSGTWANLVNGNTTNPDDDSAVTTPVSWIPSTSFGEAGVALSSASVTLPPSQWKRPFLVLSGTLTANVQVFLPQIPGQKWLVANLCTGAFTVTVTTVTSGIVIPQGGYASPTQIYCDANSIQLAVAPLSVPISQTPSALSLVQRDNTGNIFGNYLNEATALENPAVGAVIVQNTAADGYLRKISVANFISKLSLATLAAVGTAISTALDSYTNTTDMNAAIATAAALLTPLPTMAGSASSGSFKIGNIIINFGTATLTSDPQNIAFATGYTTACYAVIPIGVVSSDSNIPILGIGPPSTGRTFFTVYSSITTPGDTTFNYIAIGK